MELKEAVGPSEAHATDALILRSSGIFATFPIRQPIYGDIDVPLAAVFESKV